VVADPNGNFTAPLVLFPNSLLSDRIADATIADVTPPVTATANFLVVPGTVTPPDFVNRR
jgi:hypothetical protein